MYDCFYCHEVLVQWLVHNSIVVIMIVRVYHTSLLSTYKMREELDMLFLLEHFSLEDLVKAEEEYINYESKNTDNTAESYSDSELTEAFNHLTKDDLKRIITEERINRKRVLKIAAVYGLETEVRICMDLVGMTPTEALAEWNLL